MTGVVLPVLLALLAQSADGVKEAQSAAAEGSHSSPAPSAPSTPGKKSFIRLFTLPERPQSPDRDPVLVIPAPEQKPATRIVCGMVVIHADPAVDPKFVIRAPADTSGQKIRRIPPPVCAD